MSIVHEGAAKPVRVGFALQYKPGSVELNRQTGGRRIYYVEPACCRRGRQSYQFRHSVITGIIIVITRHTARVTGEMGMFVRMASLLTITMVALMCAHVVEISVWAGYYEWTGLEVKNAASFEFAFENYTAFGYGDAVPAEGWRLTGPITALNGLLLVGSR